MGELWQFHYPSAPSYGVEVIEQTFSWLETPFGRILFTTVSPAKNRIRNSR